MARSQTCRQDRWRNHSRAESGTTDNAAGAGHSARANRLTGQDVAAPAARHQPTRPRLDPLSARAVAGEPDTQPIAIDTAPTATRPGVDQVRVVPVALADRSGLPLVERLPGEADYPAGHRDGDTVGGEVEDQQVHHFGSVSRAK